MATTFVDYDGDGNATKSFSFPSIKEADIKVEVDEVVKTVGTHYNITSYTTTGGGNVVFIDNSGSGGTNHIPQTSSNKIRIFRDTDVDNAKATFTAGSSVKAGDLNNNQTQILYAAQEEQNQTIQTHKIKDAAVTTAKIKDANVTTAKIAADNITSALIADDQINSEHYVDESIDTQHIANLNVTTAKIDNSAVTTVKIADLNVTRGKLEADAIDGTKLADNAVNTEHYTDNSIQHVHLQNDIIDGDNIQDDAVNNEHIADNAVRANHIQDDAVTSFKIANNAISTSQIVDDTISTIKIIDSAVTEPKIADGSVTSAKLNAATVITSSEQAAATTNDTSFLTSAAADARFFNISTGDTIKDGDTFPDNDTTIATTAAINDRIIDLVDDVGGFVPVNSETSFPSANPDVNGGAGTIVSVKEASTDLVPSGTTVTIANGRGLGLAVTITGVSATIPSGFGFLAETTTTDHTYAFHRLVPKATEVTTVAGISANVTTVATNIADINTVAADLTEDTSEIETVATDITNVNNVGNDIANVNTTAGSIANVNTVATNIANVNTVAANDSNITSVAGNESNINSAVSNASNINSAVSNASNINTVAGSISNVNTAATNIANINTTATNINDVNNFAGTYQIASSAPSTDGSGNALAEGDLYFDTSSNELQVYNGSSWQGGVTAGTGFASSGTNTFTGNQTIQNAEPKLILNDSGDNPDFSIRNSNGTFLIHDDTNTQNRLGITSSGTVSVAGNLDVGAGLDVTGNITVSGNVDGRDVAADGTKLDGIESAAKDDQTAAEIKTLLDSNGIVNSNVDASAAIAGTKVSPDFGSQNIVTTGTLTGADIRAENATFDITNTANNKLGARFQPAAGQFFYHNHTLKLNTSSTGIDVAGSIAVTGTVDGRDVAADGTKLDGIEASATADQTASEIKTLLQSDKLTQSEIANDAITSALIADDTITATNIAAGTIGGNQIASNTIGTTNYADDSVDDDKLSHTGVSAATYGSATAIPVLTVNAQGRISSASTATINSDVISTQQAAFNNRTLATGFNHIMAGPVTIASGQAITLSGTAKLTIIG